MAARAPKAAVPDTEPAEVEEDSDLVGIDENPDHGAKQLALLPRSPLFFYAHHPKRWAVVAGKLVPELATVRLLRGANQCGGEPGAAVPDWRPTSTAWQRDGYTLIPHKLGPGGKFYVRRVPVRGGFAHISCFSTPHGGTDVVLTDLDAYAAWLEDLMAKGHIPRPQLWALEALRKRLKGRLGNMVDRAKTAPSKDSIAERLRADVAVVEAEIATLKKKAKPVATEAVGIED